MLARAVRPSARRNLARWEGRAAATRVAVASPGFTCPASPGRAAQCRRSLGATASSAPSTSLASKFPKLMVANRGEIAIRILRAANELGVGTCSVFTHEDRFSPHRYKADESFLITGPTPVAAYLSIPEMIKVATDAGVKAIHPGYGFLSENANFAQACADAGITFVGPPPSALRTFGDKTAARALAQRAGVPCVPGTQGAVQSTAEAEAFVAEHGLPVIIKAAWGGGGRGMRVVNKPEELGEAFKRATSEAQAAFSNGACFIEKYVGAPRHIEVQVLADAYGNIVHLFERDCSVQRRHQKVVEMAPALQLDAKVREGMLADAVKLARAAGYVNAGTVEFLLDTATQKYYFMEVNPRIQVEHTVTEEVTGIDIVQAQIRIAAGWSLPQMGLTQDKISVTGFAIQCRITTEDPARNFAPDSGILSVYRTATGQGIRIDDGPGYPGAPITPFFDSLLSKVTAHAPTFEASVAKMTRALREHCIRGVTTNIGFLVNVLSHPDFRAGPVTTLFIEQHPEVLRTRAAQNRGEKLLRFLTSIAVNGPEPALGATGPPPLISTPTIPKLPLPPAAPPTAGGKPMPQHLRKVLQSGGPAAFARAVREAPGTLLMDTTWRDAHQSLLATRMRTRDLLAIAPATREALAGAYSLECWGGATFDVALRFLRECPWDRLDALREAVPDIPFQMLFRGANAVGYSVYPDNAVFKFCEVAQRHGIDVFRVFDALNYEPNLRLGIEAAGASGGVVEAAMSYTGDVFHGEAGRRGADYKYKLEYYLSLGRLFSEAGAHVLCVKDMAGLLTPQSATLLIGALRAEFPAMPIHVHTHDTAGTGVASMIAAVQAGADAVDVATDAMSGSTSQPSMGALVAALAGTPHDTGVSLRHVAVLNEYWDECRGLYAPFESGQLTGSSDVYDHEIPGGQLTNLIYQSKQLGLAGQFGAIKRAYAEANRLLGDIPKVTPSSKTVGDLAQFMVSNKLTAADVTARADSLSFPSSVVEYLLGALGVPPGGFPEPLRCRVLGSREHHGATNGRVTGGAYAGRPGAELPPLDFGAVRDKLRDAYGDTPHGSSHRQGALPGATQTRDPDVDVMSYVMFPQVFEEWMRWSAAYGDVSVLPTACFTQPMRVGQEVAFDIQQGKTLYIRLKSLGEVDASGYREVTWELNGEARVVKVQDKRAASKATAGGALGASGKAAHVKADPADPKQVAAPMPGVVVDLRATAGKAVKAGEVVAVLSAMKMESAVTAPRAGVVKSVSVAVGDTLEGGDLVAVVE